MSKKVRNYSYVNASIYFAAGTLVLIISGRKNLTLSGGGAQWNIKNSPFGLTFLDRVIHCKAALVLNACLLPLSESSISLVNTTKNFWWSNFMGYWNFVKLCEKLWNFVKLIFEISMKLIAIFKIVKFQNPRLGPKGFLGPHGHRQI